MQRTGLIAPLAGLVATLAAGQILATVALAADPTVMVEAGDTLTRLSKRHGVSIATLVELNDLVDPNRIMAGQRLRIATAPPAQPASTPAAQPATARAHTVERGQNLTVIARSYGVTVAAIVQANGISNPRVIFAGQQLTIPGTAEAAAVEAAAPAAQPAPAPAEARVHTVERGQNLTVIARSYGVTVAAIVQANGISDPSRIYAGQRLTITGAAAAAAPAPAVSSGMPVSMAALVASRDAVRRVIVEEANSFGVPVAFALAVAWQESGWQQGVVSHAGAVGVMQLMPATADWVGGAMLGTRVEIDDMRHNVRAGVRLLAHYLAYYQGDRDRVLAAYYQGQSAVDRHGIYPISRPYIASIKTLERLFGG